MLVFHLARVQRDQALALLGQGLQLGIELGLLQLVALQACLLQLLAQRLALCMALRVCLRGGGEQRADDSAGGQQGNGQMSQRHATPP